MPLPQTLGRLTFARPLTADAATVSALYVDTTTGQYVVVRTVSEARASDPDARDDFRRQAYAAGPVLQVGQAPDGTPYVVVPYGAPPSASPAAPPTPTVAPPAGPPAFAPPALTSPAFAPPAFAPPSGPQTGHPWPAPSGPKPPSHSAAPATRPRRLLWPILVAAAALVLAAGGLAALLLTRGGSDAPSASTRAGAATGTSPSADPTLGPDAPHPGECRNVPDSVIAALSDDSPVVSCDAPHKAYTFYVGRYRGDTPDNDYASHECVTRVAKTLGVTEAKAKLTAYTTIFFQPSDQQWAAGARWFRCDLALVAAGPSLRPLPLGEILLPAPLPDKLAGCMTAAHERTTCDEPHAYRAFATWTATGGPTPPTNADLTAQAEKACPAGAVYFTWPGAGTWRYGDRTAVCWRASTS